MHQPRVSTPFPGPKAREILALDRKFMSQSMTRLYPIVAEQGCGCWISDVDGNLFLDFTAGIAVNATGCLHPQIMEAIEKQAHRLLHFSLADFYHPLGAQLAQRLAGLFPGGGDARVFLCNSGAEAVEAAIKLARWHTKRHASGRVSRRIPRAHHRRARAQRQQADPQRRLRSAACRRHARAVFAERAAVPRSDAF